MKNVLLVDDDAVCNLLSTKALQRFGLINDIHAASNGRQALGLLTAIQGSSQLPDIILLNLNMSVMDGFTFLEAFRRL